MSINLTVVIDNDEAIKKFKELQKAAKTTTSEVVTDSERMDMAIRKFGSALASLGVGFSLTEFARQVATVRGEFQQLEVAFSTMLGSKEKADALMQRTVELAATTPFDLQGVAQGTKQLLAYGSTAEEVTDEIRMIGDIAAGLSIPLGDLVYLYGTTRTQGRLFTQDLRQFMGRGIPLAEELAKQFGVTKDAVSALVTEGKVGFDDVYKALVAMTSEGGKFHNLMEAQSKTITGQMSNLGDSIQQMFNNIGKESEGAISSAISGASYLVENYEKVGRVLFDIIAAYGSYKAAVLLVNAAHKTRAIYLAAEATATRLSAVLNKQLTAEYVLQAKALKTLNISKYLTNPYVLAGVAVAGLTFSIYKYITAKSEEERAQEKVNEKMEEYNELLNKDKDKASQAASTMKDANATAYERVRAYNTLISTYPELLKKYDEEKIKLMELTDLNRELANINAQRSEDELLRRRSEIDATIAKGPKKFVQTGGAGVGTYVEDTGLINSLKAERKIIENELAEIQKAKDQAAFDILPSEEKIKVYQSQLDAVNKKIQEQITLQEEADSVRAGELQGEIDALNTKRAELESRINTLKGDDEPTGGGADDVKAIAQERQKALQDAHQAEMELQKSFLVDKAFLLQYEKDQAVKAIEERIAATTDAEVRGSLERQKIATEALYDRQIDAALQEEVNAFAAEAKENEAQQQATLKNLLNKYETYTRSRAAIEKSFNDDITALQQQRTDANAESVDKAIAEARRQMEEALLDFDMEQIGSSDLFADLFSNVNEMTSRQLKTIIADTRKLVQYLNGSSLEKPIGFTKEQLETLKQQPDQIKAIYDALIEKQEEFDRRNEYPFSNIINGLKMLKEAHQQTAIAAKATTKEEKEVAENNAANQQGRAMEYLKSAALQAANSVSWLSGKMSELADATDSQSVKDMAESLASVGSFISDVVQGAVAGGWIGAAVGGATNLLTQMINSFVQAEKSRQEFLANERDFAYGYQLLLLQLKEQDYDTIFGTNALKRAIDAYKKAQEALALYNAEVSEKAKDYLLDNPISRFESMFTERPEEYKRLLETMYGELTKLEAMTVKTRDRSGFAEFFGAKDEYTMLKDLRPQLWNEDGSFNVEEAKLFLETNTQINDTQRDMIQNVIDLKEQYDDLMDEADKVLETIIGDISTDLTDIIFDSVRNGTDAWDAFHDRGAEVINDLGKMMVQELFVRSYLDQFSDQLREAFLMDDVSASSYKIADIINDMFDGMGTMLEGASNAAEAWDKAATENGFSMDSLAEEVNKVSSSGFQAMSQETGSELNGRFTDIQGKVTEMRSYVMELMTTGKLQYNETVNIRDIMIQINGNVADIRSYAKALPEMRDSINSMNRKLDNL